jgi:signal transduction histidine kinase
MQNVYIEDREVVAAAAQKAMEHMEVPVIVNVRKVNKDGGLIYTRWDFIAMPDGQGQPDYVLCLGSEITSFVEKEVANSLKLKEIIFNQSHIVRRPLTNVMGLSKYIAENVKLEDEELTSMLLKIYEETQKLDAIVRFVTAKAEE